jgi:hypothetical protein
MSMLAAGIISDPLPVAAVTINFGGNVHSLTGSASGQLTTGGFQMSLMAGPAGAVLNENHAAALGVDSRNVPGAIDVGPVQDIDKINLLGGSPPVAAVTETVAFSFNRSGVLLGLKFDGVKDENLEFVRLALPGGDTLVFFDFEVPLRLTQLGFTTAALNAPNARFLDDEQDDAAGLHIPFQAGQTFTLSYGEALFPAGYIPRVAEAPNGIRWQGLVVVPEPVAMELVRMATICAAVARLPPRRRAAR